MVFGRHALESFLQKGRTTGALNGSKMVLLEGVRPWENILRRRSLILKAHERTI